MSRHPVERGREPPIVSSIESTLPPTSPQELLEASGTSVLVFSHDAALASVIKRVAEGRYPLRVIDEWQDLVRLISNDVGRIVVLDVDALSRPVEKALAELNRCLDWLVIVIAAKQNEAQDFMRFWSERRIHRLLIKPAALGITRLLLESAVARYVELRELHEETDSLEIPPDLRHYENEGGLKLWHAGAAVGLLAAVAAGLYLMGVPPFGAADDSTRATGILTNGDPASVPGVDTNEDVVAPTNSRPNPLATSEGLRVAEVETSPVAPGGDDSAPSDPFADLIAAAERAELAGRITTPASDNALDHYLEILGDAPSHATARANLDRLLEQLYTLAEDQFLDADLTGVEETLTHIARADSESSRLRFLREQLSQARATAEALAAAEAAAAAATERAEVERAAAQRALAERQAAVRQVAEREAAEREAAERAAAAPASSRPPEPDSAPEPIVAAVRPGPATPTQSLANPELASILTLVERRLAQGQLLAPAGDSARDYLQRAIDLDPSDADVIAAVDGLRAALIAEIGLAVEAADLDRADRIVGVARELGPVSAELEDWQAAIADARREQLEAELTTTAERAALRIEQGRLAGDDDSAITLLAHMRALDAADPRIGELESALQVALTTATRAAIADGNFARARTLLDALIEDFEISTVALERELELASRQTDFLANPASIGELELLRSVPAEYPRVALLQETTGWVELLFTVDREGRTQDIVIVESQPEGTFDDAAVTALNRYRFAPFELDGVVYERRARVRLRFVLD